MCHVSHAHGNEALDGKGTEGGRPRRVSGASCGTLPSCVQGVQGSCNHLRVDVSRIDLQLMFQCSHIAVAGCVIHLCRRRRHAGSYASGCRHHLADRGRVLAAVHTEGRRGYRSYGVSDDCSLRMGAEGSGSTLRVRLQQRCGRGTMAAKSRARARNGDPSTSVAPRDVTRAAAILGSSLAAPKVPT